MKTHANSRIQKSKPSLAAQANLYARAAAEILAETLWPTRCAVCDKPGTTLCSACISQLPYIDWNLACRRCGAPFGVELCCECNAVMLSSANRTSLPYTQAIAAVSYDETARRIVSAYKDKNELRLSENMATIMARYIPCEWIESRASITFIPASTSAFRKRGFDHAELLARNIASITELELVSIFARPESFDQRQLSRAERIANMKGRLKLQAGITVPHTLLIVDDVCTTGSTLFAACEALSETPIENIYCLTFARV